MSRRQTDDAQPDEAQPESDGAGNGRKRSVRRPPVRAVIAGARNQMAELTGRQVEGVSAVERDGEGWNVTLEMVEMERIPASTSVLGSYQVSLDADGEVIEYSRIQRYYRNQAGEGASG